MRLWYLALLLLLTSACHAAAPVQQSDLTATELRFVTANAEFTLLHEMGHLLINELQLPVLGREEDAADQLGFVGLFLLQGKQRDANFYAKLLDVADYWRLEWRLPKAPEEKVYSWDSHGLDAQRFYNIACLAYGSDPQNLEWIITGRTSVLLPPGIPAGAARGGLAGAALSPAGWSTTRTAHSGALR